MSALRDLPTGRHNENGAAVLPELPLLDAALGPPAVDIGGLYAKAGL